MYTCKVKLTVTNSRFCPALSWPDSVLRLFELVEFVGISSPAASKLILASMIHEATSPLPTPHTHHIYVRGKKMKKRSLPRLPPLKMPSSDWLKTLGCHLELEYEGSAVQSDFSGYFRSKQRPQRPQNSSI